MIKVKEDELYDRLKTALNALDKTRRQVQKLESALIEPIAVIGMACELPGDICSLEEFWQALIQSKEVLGDLPDERWDADGFVDSRPQMPGKMISKQGGFLKNHQQFDAHFFGISPREAVSMDPQQRLVLKVSWRALEQAGISPSSIAGTNTGVFVGVTNTDYAHAMLKQGSVDQVDAYSATGNALNVIAGRLSYFLNLQGPSAVFDTACSSSLVALHNACQSLRLNECDTAFCVGVNVILLPEGNIALSQANMLSPDGQCFTFDARANGYVRSEGCVSFLLKRAADATRDGDKIYALIRSSATNHGGKSSGLTVPNAQAQEHLIRQAIKSARLEPGTVDYIEAHGTGTALGDPIEVTALNAVFKNSHNAERPLLIGSVKSNFGHLESASGVLGLLKVIMAMQHGLIPANQNFSTLNPLINLDLIPAQVVVKNTPWLGRKIAGVSSFGFSGINAHVIVASAPEVEPQPKAYSTRTHEVVCCSAKDEEALKKVIEELRHFLLEHQNLSLTTLAYNYNACRAHFSFRQAFVGQSVQDLSSKLVQFKENHAAINSTKRKKIAFLISGQGSQYVGMGKSLYQSSKIFKELIDNGCNTLNVLLDIYLQDLMFTDLGKLQINQTLYTQPILFIFNYALAKLWETWGVEADCYIGHSIGEYVAATLAGVIDFGEALLLVYERARLMQGLAEGGGMVLVMANKEALEPLLNASDFAIDIAIITNEYTVLSGKKAHLDQFIKSIAYPIKPLEVSHAFHSSLMDPIVDDFIHIAQVTQYHTPQKQVISNLTGAMYTSNTVSAEYWADHMRHPVDLKKSMDTLAQEKYDILLEIGPRPTFSSSSTQFSNMLWLYSLRPGADNWHSLGMNIAKLYEFGLDIHWDKVFAGFNTEKIAIPGYPFQKHEYWGLVSQKAVTTSLPLDHSLYGIEKLPKANPKAVNPKLIKPVQDATILLTNDKKLSAQMKPLFADLRCCEDLESFKEQKDLSAPKHIVFYMKGGKKSLSLEIKQSYLLFLNLIKLLLSAPIQGCTLWLITNNGVELLASPLLGLRKCLLLESNLIACVHLALDSKIWDEQAIKQLALEISCPCDEKQIIYEQNKRLVPRLKPYDIVQYPKKNPVLREEGVYLITGGQGDLGLEVMNWYVHHGAKQIILLSRRKTSAKTKQQIKTHATSGCTIECLVLDVSSKNTLSHLFAEFGKNRPPLRGIIHAAGVLDDALIQNQTEERFEGLLKSKILGAWHLHELSLDQNLDHFVLFSSISSVFGTYGQGNYAAANSFLDSLAEMRSHQGLPALSINWGPWSEIGMAKDIGYRAEGLHKLSPALGTALFESLMQHEVSGQVLAVDLDWKKLLAQQKIRIPFLEHFWPVHEQKMKQNPQNALDINTLSIMEPSELRDFLIQLLQTHIQHILHLDTSIKPTQNFFEQGMDSLMAIELRNNLQALLQNKINLSQTIFFELSTLQELAEYLVSLILKTETLVQEEHVLNEEEELLKNLDQMNEDDIDALLQEILDNEEKS